MNRFAKVITASVLACSMVISAAGCSEKNYKEYEKIGNPFIEALLDRDYDECAKLCKDADEAEIILSDDVISFFDPLIESVFDTVEYELTDVDDDGDKLTLSYKIIMVDLEEAVSDLNDSADEEDILDSISDCGETVEIKLVLKFVKDGDNWLLVNIEDIFDDFMLDEIVNGFCEARFNRPYESNLTVETAVRREEVTLETEVLETTTTEIVQTNGLASPYQAIIDDIISKLDNQSLMFDTHMGIVEIMAFCSSEELPGNIGIALHDFNNDGVMELFILDLSDGNEVCHNILEMYTIDDSGEAYAAISSGVQRNRFYLYDSNVILNIGSAGWAYTIVAFSTMADNGLDLEDFEIYWSDDACYSDAPSGYDIYWYTSSDRSDAFDSGANGVFYCVNDDFDFELLNPDNGIPFAEIHTLSDYM